MAIDGVGSTGSTAGIGGKYGQFVGQNNQEEFTNSIFSKYDIDKNSIVSINEQKIGIVSKIKNAVGSNFAKIFSGDLAYDSTDKKSVENIDRQVEARQNRAIADSESDDPDIITNLEGTIASNSTQDNSSSQG